MLILGSHICIEEIFKMSGGYRECSGRSKSGYYCGMYLGSTYELCWAIYHIDHHIPFTRFPGKLSVNGVSYFPDFLLGDGITIVECKGYESPEKVIVKTRLAESFGYNVRVLRKDDLKFAFDYVKAKYNTTQYQTLYDGYKPVYNYVCSHCKIIFGSDKKKKTDTTFCSRSCAGFARNCSAKENYNVSIGSNENYIKGLTKEQALEVYNDNSLSYSKIAKKFGINRRYPIEHKNVLGCQQSGCGKVVYVHEAYSTSLNI